ncbi:carboxylating nicotinate-nucleotide diphosphorylase [Aurantibacillus circumpalustris]|uniref:carboxylating nicotinate-nucleotide diphosphorylase n=1 Tax=Aurantibacillus circumpalustris TaxID=3036359 RepID=UPI00295AA7BE|nr:carboxylating nicotinate-nucleotide diphosphorylase [Aurantibacillus circumpalustris]
MTDFVKRNKKHFNFKQFISNAFKEDVGDGDHTSLSTIPKNHRGKMQLLAKEDGIIAGIEAAQIIFKQIDKGSKLKTFFKDGAAIKKGDVVLIVEGNTQKMLTAERLVLNIMQRMSGIATKTAHLQDLCRGTKTQVIDTRKTTPGFRFFEKWAVLIGGGGNHRYGLYDMILIKDNHIDFAGGIEKAIDSANRYLKSKRKKLNIEVETRSLEDVNFVLKHGGVQRIMLDNYTPQQTLAAVKLINGKFEVESSGGITEKNIQSYAKCGVDFISIGALTHHVKGLDLSLKAVK